MFGLLLPIQQLLLVVEIPAALKNLSKDILESSRLNHVSSCSENRGLSQLGQEAFAVLRSISDLTSVITLFLSCSFLYRGETKTVPIHLIQEAISRP